MYRKNHWILDGFFFHDAEGNATSRFKCWIYSINFHSELESYKIVNVCLNTPTFKHLFTISSDHWYSKINFDHKKEKKTPCKLVILKGKKWNNLFFYIYFYRWKYNCYTRRYNSSDVKKQKFTTRASSVSRIFFVN